MTLAFDFNKARVDLFGGASLYLHGKVNVEKKPAAFIWGETGSGKTITLSVIAHLLGCPAFQAVKAVSGEGCSVRSDARSDQVSAIRQEPLDNFLGNSVSEELELALGITQLSPEEFREKIERLWVQNFDLDLSLLSRHPTKLSSGQQQMLAVITQVLRQPDVLLADEPFARLSQSNARRAARLLCELLGQTNILLTSQPYREDWEHTTVGPESAEYQIKDSAEMMLICQGARRSEEEHSRVAEGPLKNACLSPESYIQEMDRSENFTSLPERSVRLVGGDGASITSDPLNIDVYPSGFADSTASCRGLALRRGMNVLYGDNGSGKTLVGRVLGGDIALNPIIRIRARTFARVNHSTLTKDIGRGVPAGVTLSWLGKKGLSHFLSSHPEDGLAGHSTVRKEIGEVYADSAQASARLEFLSGIGIGAENGVAQLSYGQQKLVTYALLRNDYKLLVLDEIFANLSPNLQLLVAQDILARCRQGQWETVVVTTNRPSHTIALLVNAANNTKKLGG